MKASILFYLTLAVTVSAGQLPSCASSCVAKAIKKTGCASSDTQCICESEHYLGYLRHCSAKRCSKADQQSAIESASDLCTLVPHGSLDKPAAEAVDEVLRIQARGDEKKQPEKRTPPKSPSPPGKEAPHSKNPGPPSREPNWHGSHPKPSSTEHPKEPTPSWYHDKPVHTVW